MTDIRITEDGEDRYTEDGEVRVVDYSVRMTLDLVTGSDIDLTLDSSGTVELMLDLSSDSDIDLAINIQPPPLQVATPIRHYIWVYNLMGERVDVIA